MYIIYVIIISYVKIKSYIETSWDNRSTKLKNVKGTGVFCKYFKQNIPTNYETF